MIGRELLPLRVIMHMANSNEVIASATKDKRKFDVPFEVVTSILYADGLLLAKFNARRNHE